MKNYIAAILGVIGLSAFMSNWMEVSYNRSKEMYWLGTVLVISGILMMLVG